MKGSDELIARIRERLRLPTPDECRRIRERAKISQSDVAEALGVSRTCIVLWESGQRRPRGENLRAYVELLESLARETAQ